MFVARLRNETMARASGRGINVVARLPPCDYNKKRQHRPETRAKPVSTTPSSQLEFSTGLASSQVNVDDEDVM